MNDEPKYRINKLQSFHIDTAAPEAGWKGLQGACPFLSDWGVEKLRDGLDGHVQSIVLEPLYMCKDHRRSEEHTSELQSPCNLVCRLLLEKKKKKNEKINNKKKKIKKKKNLES